MLYLWKKKEENDGTELDAILNSVLVDIKQASEVTELLTKTLTRAVKMCYTATKLYANKADSVVLLKAENNMLSTKIYLLKEIKFLRQDLNELHRKIK